MSVAKAYLVDRLYVHEALMPDEWTETLTHHTYDQNLCRTCEHLPERFAPECMVCPGHKEAIPLYKRVRRGKHLYVGLPIGGAAKLLNVLGINRNRLEVADKRTVVFADNPLQFTGQLYHGQVVNGAKTADQRDIVRRLIPALKEQRRGACIVSPRAGKTVLATYVGCATKLRTLFIAADYMLLKQFETTVFDFTDARKKPNSVGIATNVDDFDKFDHFVCTTWQALMERHSEGARLDAIFGQFGLIIVDEAHLGASAQFFKVLNSLDAKYMLAFTGTWKRKDGKEVVSALTFGKILVEEEVETLKPTVYVIETGVKSKKKKYTNFLSDTNGNVVRNTLIAQRALDLVASDVRRHVVITHKHGAAIGAIHRAIVAEALERQDDTTSLQDDGKLVTTYTGSLPTTGRKGEPSLRDKRYAAIKSGAFRIVVAQESMVRFGVNVPLWTDIILAAPVASKISPDPNYKQLSLRPCTPAPDKPKPGIWHVVDDNDISKGCFLSTLSKSISVLKYDLDASVTAYLGEGVSASAISKPMVKRPW